MHGYCLNYISLTVMLALSICELEGVLQNSETFEARLFALWNSVAAIFNLKACCCAGSRTRAGCD